MPEFFDGLGSWSFSNDFARNIVLFNVDNSSSCRADNGEINFLVLGKGPTDDITHNVGTAGKKIITFSKANTKNCLSLHYNGDNSYLFDNEKRNI